MEKIYRIAEEIRSLDIYEANDNDETAESIAEQIQNDPLAVIQYLLEYIDTQDSLIRIL